jgi:hypothetical protein
MIGELRWAVSLILMLCSLVRGLVYTRVIPWLECSARPATTCSTCLLIVWATSLAVSQSTKRHSCCVPVFSGVRLNVNVLLFSRYAFNPRIFVFPVGSL